MSSPAPETTKDAAAAPAAAPAKGGLGAWLPLIITVVLMPVLAYVTANFILLPKLKSAAAGAHPPAAGADHAPADAHGAAAGGDDSHGEKPDEKAGAADSHGKGGKGKFTDNTSMNKLLVNVAGTMGTRYLLTSLTLVGSRADFKKTIEDNRDQLKDVATSTLSVKTINDLEKPGARNLIRTELQSVLNNVLGGNVIQEIYITELAIQ
jgi:flagellar protein FliL